MGILHLTIFLLVASCAVVVKAGGLSEEYRVKEHDKRYSREWPPAKYVPDTPGWKRLMDERLRQGAKVFAGMLI